MKFAALSTVGLLAGLASAHVSFISPCPRYSPVGENCPALPAGQSLDTGDGGINAPLYSVNLGGTAMPLCRHTTPFATPSATWTAGKPVTIKFNPNAAIHSGGNCEFSISYDNGNTFAVIHQELRYCFLNSKPASLTNTAQVLSYTFNLPANLPSSDKAVFAWSWVNASGNREFYMNCADVAIKGGSSSSYTGKQMTIANYPGYPTIPEFNGDYETGMEHYTNANKVTVSPSGGGYIAPKDGLAPISSSSSSIDGTAAYTTAPALYSTLPAPTPVDEPASTAPVYESAPIDTAVSSGADLYSTVAYSSTAAPVGHNAEEETSDSCDSGVLQCFGKGYRICIRGAWSPTYFCNGKTVCKGVGNIYCGWP